MASKTFEPYSKTEEHELLNKIEIENIGIEKGTDRFLKCVSAKRYISGSNSIKIEVQCLNCNENRVVEFYDWKYQKKHLSKCFCMRNKQSDEIKRSKSFIYSDYYSNKYIYLGKGKISRGIQYIWLRCRDCGCIIEVNGHDYLSGENFKTCYCNNKPYVIEEIKDLFEISKGYSKYSDDKLGICIGTDILLSEGPKKYTVNVKCLLCGKIREVSAEEFFNERTFNYKFCSCLNIKKELFIGARKGHLMVKSFDSDNVFLQCDCGNEIVKNRKLFLNQPQIQCSPSCVYNKYSSQYTDVKYIGKIYNNFKVKNILQRKTFYNTKLISGTYWECECLLCGSTGVYLAKEIVEGIKKSCKCESSKYYIKYKPYDIVNGIVIKDIFVIPKRGTFWQCICPFCGDTFVRDANSIITGHCGSCGCENQSIGAAVVYSVLEDFSRDKKFRVYKEYFFDDLKSKSYLRYDFALKFNNRLILIEYDGEHHKRANIKGIKDKNEAERIFREIQYRDRLKNEYAKNKKIPLYRIDYTLDKNIIKESIIKILKEEGVI